MSQTIGSGEAVALNISALLSDAIGLLLIEQRQGESQQLVIDRLIKANKLLHWWTDPDSLRWPCELSQLGLSQCEKCRDFIPAAQRFCRECRPDALVCRECGEIVLRENLRDQRPTGIDLRNLPHWVTPCCGVSWEDCEEVY